MKQCPPSPQFVSEYITKYCEGTAHTTMYVLSGRSCNNIILHDSCFSVRTANFTKSRYNYDTVYGSCSVRLGKNNCTSQ
jgi:hypothetical protein